MPSKQSSGLGDQDKSWVTVSLGSLQYATLHLPKDMPDSFDFPPSSDEEEDLEFFQTQYRLEHKSGKERPTKVPRLSTRIKKAAEAAQSVGSGPTARGPNQGDHLTESNVKTEPLPTAASLPKAFVPPATAPPARPSKQTTTEDHLTGSKTENKIFNVVGYPGELTYKQRPAPLASREPVEPLGKTKSNPWG